MSKLFLRVPLYLAFDLDESTKKRKPNNFSLGNVLDWLEQVTNVTYDTEGQGNPHGWVSSSVGWDEGVEVDETEFKYGGLYPCRDGQRVRIELRDARGVLVEAQEMDANAAGDKARKFLVLQGADPDEDGKDAQSGTIRFSPVE